MHAKAAADSRWHEQRGSARTLGTVLGPRASGQQWSTTVPSGQPSPQRDRHFGCNEAAGPHMACERSRWAPRGQVVDDAVAGPSYAYRLITVRGNVNVR